MKKRILRRVSSAFLAVIMILVMLPASVMTIGAAELSGECGASGSSLTWTFDPETGTITISGTGKMVDYYANSSTIPWRPYYSSIERVIVEEGVTGIGKYAFYACDNLMSVTLPSTLPVSYSTIGAYAFQYCYKLIEVINYSSLPLLEGNSNYGYVSFYAKGIHTGESRIVSDGEFKFYSSEEGNYLLSYMGNEAELTLPESCGGENYKIHNYAFYCNDKLKSIEIPEAVTSIGDYAFYNCSSLESVNLPSKLTHIGAYAFNNCSSIEDVTLPDGLTNIGNYSFYGCSSIESEITVPVGVESIGEYAFYGCSKISGVTVSEGVTGIGKCAFNGCVGLESVDVPNSLTSIGQSAFDGCDEIIEKENGVWYIENWIVGSDEDVTGEGLRADTVGIADNAMARRDNIRFIVFPDTLKYIGYSAFYNCNSFMSVTIPASVLTIDDQAFAYCERLFEVVNNSTFTVTAGSSSYGHLSYCAMEVHSGTSKIKKSGDYYFYSYNGVNYMVEYVGNDTDIVLPANYNGENYEMYGVFSGKTNITGITLPSGMTSIGEKAFSECTELVSVKLSNSITSIKDDAFYKCSSLTSIVIPSSVEIIGERAFSNCTSLESVTVSDNSKLKSIGMQAFNGCSNLTSFTFGANSNLEVIDQRAFYNCKVLEDIELPDSLLKVAEYAFSFCNAITEAENGVKYVDDWAISIDKTYYSGQSWDVVLRQGTEGIADSAFGYQSNIKTVQLPSSLRVIGASAFASCDALGSVNIPDNVVYIGDWAFRDCRVLTNATISDSSKLKIMGDQVFFGCKKLENINLPDGLTSIGEGAFNDCESFTSIVIPDGVTSISARLFNGCINLESVVLPDSITVIEESAFSECESLVNISIPKNVTEIGSLAFDYCSSLVKINLPGALKSIKYDAFSDCRALKTAIYCGTESEWSLVEKGTLWSSSYYAPDILFHNYEDGICTECGGDCPHENVVDGVCSACGTKMGVIGDVDGDEEVTNSDVLMIYRYIYNAETYPLDVEAADVDKDGDVTNADVLMIYRYIYNPLLYPLA